MVRSQYHELVTKEKAENFFALFPKRTLVDGVAIALEKGLFDLKDELDKVIKSFKNPAFAYVECAQTAKLFDLDEINNTQLRREAIKQRALQTGDEIDLESWPDVQEKPLSKKLGKALFEVHQIETDYGFSPRDSTMLLRLKGVRDYLEEILEVDLSKESWLAANSKPPSDL
jgi:hypothetical protein